jgi:hypothetical protein
MASAERCYRTVSPHTTGVLVKLDPGQATTTATSLMTTSAAFEPRAPRLVLSSSSSATFLDHPDRLLHRIVALGACKAADVGFQLEAASYSLVTVSWATSLL